MDILTLTKLAAARAVSPRRLKDPLDHLAWVESGAPFEEAGIAGFLEGVPASAEAIRAEEVEGLLRSIQSEDHPSLGRLYMKLVPRRQRHGQGEYYTPAWLVDLVLDRAGFGGEEQSRLLDPMCGAGVFLGAAVSRLRRRRPDLPAGEIADLVQGMDLNPAAVLMARAEYLFALKGAVRRGPLAIPVACADAILCETRGAFDVVAGNPPWVGWESLSRAYRERTKDLWRHHGLFADHGRDAGMQVMLGRGRKDLAMLATYTAADKFLRPGGRLAFVITQTLFKSVGSGAGFRRFVLGDGTPLKVISVDDFGARQIFFGAGTRSAVVTLLKGEPTTYPVSYQVWPRGGGGPEPKQAEPVDDGDATSAWLTGTNEQVSRLRGVLGPSPYRARAGAYTGGANGVYWLRALSPEEEGVRTVENLADSGKRDLPTVTARVETDLLFPLLRAADVLRFQANSSAWILLPQDPERRRGIDREVMAARYPLALAYLERFTGALAARRDRGTRALLDHGAPFYSIFSVSAATMSAWKVVWPRIASRVTAAAVGPHDGSPVIPQETCTFIACADEAEAIFLAGMLNSTLFNEAAASFAQTGGKSFGAPHLLRHIAVPRYDHADEDHRRLVELVARAGPGAPQDLLDEAASGVWRLADVAQINRLPSR